MKTLELEYTTPTSTLVEIQIEQSIAVLSYDKTNGTNNFDEDEEEEI
jgi:hypothetical protein